MIVEIDDYEEIMTPVSVSLRLDTEVSLDMENAVAYCSRPTIH